MVILCRVWRGKAVLQINKLSHYLLRKWCGGDFLGINKGCCRRAGAWADLTVRIFPESQEGNKQGLKIVAQTVAHIFPRSSVYSSCPPPAGGEVASALWKQPPENIRRCYVCASITRHGTVILPVPLKTWQDTGFWVIQDNVFLIKFRLEMFMFLLEREGQGAWIREGREIKEGGREGGKGVRGTEWVFCGN